MIIFLITAGIFSMIYFIVTAAAAGINRFTASVWLLGGSCLLAAGLAGRRLKRKYARLPFWFRLPVFIILMITGAILAAAELKIVREGMKKPQKNVDYVIVLGARVKGTKPSKALYRRIESAAVYLKENPRAKVVVSGGRGPDEGISEAECMRRELIDMGIDETRITKEENSKNTEENLKNSVKLIGTDKKVVIATCSFHMYRAMCLAKKMGMKKVSGCASCPGTVLLLNYYVREFFAVIHHRITGRI